MSKKISRRALMIGGASAGGLLLTGAGTKFAGPVFNGLYRAGEALTLASHRLLLSVAGQPLAREFDVADISKTFPAIGTLMPDGEHYQRLLSGGFADWRLSIDGLVAQPMAISLAELKRMPARTQITSHSCERGWTAIAQWTGVPLSQVLNLVKPLPTARYAVFHCADEWYDSYHLDAFEAMHPQTILAYGMNGDDLPIQHGAPVRLRVERQVGYKSLKFIDRLQLVESFDHIGGGNGSLAADWGWQWYGGI